MTRSDISTAERALFYGDAVFETIRISNGRVPLLQRHYDRLCSALKALRFEVPGQWRIGDFEAALLDGAPGNARARFTVWRAPGGLYMPTDQMPHFAVFHTPLDGPAPIWMESGVNLGFCEDIQLHHDVFSGIKALNAPRYVQASITAHAEGYDDALLCNTQGHISEATSSNVFWYAHDQWYTPPLLTGCVNGIMRHYVLDYFIANDIPFDQQTMAPNIFKHVAQEVFLTNAVRCIVPVRSFSGNKHLEQKHTKQLFDALVGQIFLS